MHLDGGFANHKNVRCRVQVPKHAQSRRIPNLDAAGGGAVMPPCAGDDEALKARRVHHGDLLVGGADDLRAPEAAAGEADAHPEQVPLDAERLQDGAPGEDEIHVLRVHDDAAEAELAEVGERDAAREVSRGGELPEAEVEAGERGHAEEGGGEAQVERPRAVHEDELLDALHGEHLEPVREHALELLHAAGREVDAPERARVRAHDAGHGVGDAACRLPRLLGGVVGSAGGGGGGGEEVGVDEDERRGAPERAPAAGERGGARGVLDGEAGDDPAEERVGEGADAVDGVVRGERVEARGGGDGRVGEGVVDVGEHARHRPLHVVRVVPAPPELGRHRAAHGDGRHAGVHGRRSPPPG
ncbi:Os04g0208550, partial [Oryza sativa Japonica Group]